MAIILQATRTHLTFLLYPFVEIVFFVDPMSFRRSKRHQMLSKNEFILKKELGGIIIHKSEVKYRDLMSIGNTYESLTFTTTINLELTAIASGSDINQRIGNSIQVTGLNANFNFKINGGGAGTNQASYARVVLYTPYDVTGSDLDVHSYDQIPKEEYIVWSDEYVHVGWTNSRFGVIELKKSWKPYMKVLYTGSLSTEISHNKLMCMISSDLGTAAVPRTVDVAFNVRMFYHDV